MFNFVFYLSSIIFVAMVNLLWRKVDLLCEIKDPPVLELGWAEALYIISSSTSSVVIDFYILP